MFNLGNKNDFPSGYLVGDIFSYVVLYTGYEAYGSHTIAVEGGFTKTVVLIAVPTAPSLRYFQPQDFLDFFNMKTTEDDADNGVKVQQIVKIGQMIENAIDEDTDNVFDDNDGSYYAQTEYLDTDKYQQEYHLTKLPVNSITAAYTTQSGSEAAPDYTNNISLWTSLTEGTDFVVDKGDTGTGRIQITSSTYYPISRKWGLYVSYLQGRTSVPADIKMLAIVETGLKLLGAAMVKSKVKGSEKDTGDLTWFTSFRNRIINNYASSASMNTI